MDFEINMMDLCDMAGGMYNAVEFLIKFTKDRDFEVKVGGDKCNNRIISHEIINDCYSELPGDQYGLGGVGGNWSYGFLRRRNRDYIIFTFHNVNEKDLDLYFSNFKQIILDKERKKEELRLKMKDVDPYGEEDWENESKVNESNLTLSDFKVGDRIIYTWKGNWTEENTMNGLKNDLHGLTGTVIKNYHRNNFLGIQFDKKLTFLHDCNELGENEKCYYVIPSAVEHLDAVKQEERRRKQEELRLKMKDVDPYGEEDWENESKIYEYKEFRKTGEIFNFADYIITKNNWQDMLRNLEDFLVIGEWYRIKFTEHKNVVIKLSGFHWALNTRPEFRKHYHKNFTINFDRQYSNGEIKEPDERYRSMVGNGVFWFGLRNNNKKFRDIIDHAKNDERIYYINWEYNNNTIIEHLERPNVIKKTDIDPYGEEDWENESKVNESTIVDNKKYIYKDISFDDNIEYTYLKLHKLIEEFNWLYGENNTEQLKKEIEDLILDKHIKYFYYDYEDKSTSIPIKPIKEIATEIKVEKHKWEDYGWYKPYVYINGNSVFLNRDIKIMGKREISERDPYGEEDWENESKVNEYVEFNKTGEEYNFNGNFDYGLVSFLKKGEWYRLICQKPKNKFYYHVVQRLGKENKFVRKKRKKMLLFVFRFHSVYSDYGWNALTYDRIYINGEIQITKPFEKYIDINTISIYKDVVFQHIEDVETKKRKEELKLKYKDVDPYGEEDWENENESILYDFNLGDRVEYVGDELSRRLRKNNLGTVIKVWGGGEYGVQFDENIGGHDCQINGKWGHCWNVNKYELRHTDPEKIEKRKRKQEELRLKYKDIDPYGEEDWENESKKITHKMITKYKIFEELTNPYDEGSPLILGSHYNMNLDGFKGEILQDLRQKLIGKTIYMDAVYRPQHRFVNGRLEYDMAEKPIIVNGKSVKPLYHFTVHDVVYAPEHRGETHYFDVVDENGRKYKLNKIIDKKTYDRFAKKAQDFIKKEEEKKKKQEKLRDLTKDIDPYGEEDWGPDFN